MFKEQITPALMLGNLFEIQHGSSRCIVKFCTYRTFEIALYLGSLPNIMYCISIDYWVLCIVLEPGVTRYYVLY